MSPSKKRQDDATGRTVPNDDTVEADRDDAVSGHGPDRPPTDEEEELAEQTGLDPNVAERSREMFERGANERGEGRID